MSETLERCPFCGGEAKMKTAHVEDWTYTHISAVCKKCYCEGPGGLTPDVAIKAWNTRAPCARCEALDKTPGGE